MPLNDNVIILHQEADWIAYCPECEGEHFQIVVKSPQEPEIIGIKCSNEDCGYYAEQE